MRLERTGLKARACRDCAPLALIVNENCFERSRFALDRLAGVLVDAGVHDDSDVPNGRMKLARDKFFALVVVRFETVALEGSLESHFSVSVG